MQEMNVSNRIRSWFFLTLVLTMFFGYEMGNRHFADPDEGRYVEIPREMVVSGDYVTPKLNGLKYFEKPALFYWMQASAIKIFGITETSMRIFTVLFAILGCLSVFFVGSRRYSFNTGLLASAILATNIIYYAHSRLIILDLVNSIFISGSLWCFYLAFVDPASRKHKNTYRLLMYAFSALACLTKGLIGCVLPGLVGLLWIAFTKKWSTVKEIFSVTGILIFLLIFLPWHVLVASRNEDFLHFYFVVEHFLRYTTTMHARYQPCWVFIPILLVGFMPWTGMALVGLKKVISQSMAKKDNYIFFACWIFGIFAFFSFSNSKLIPYILPIIQPLALAASISICETSQNNADFKIGCIITVISIAIFFAVYFITKSQICDVLSDDGAAILINVFFSILALAGFVLLFAIFDKIKKESCVMLLIFLSANLMWIFNKAAVFYQEVKKPTTKHLAEIININRKKDDLVFCYKRYYQDFPVYLRSTVGVVDFIGELQFGLDADKNNDLIVAENQFWNIWHTSKKRVFLLLSRDRYRDVFAKRNDSHNILDFDKNFIVITNK